MHIAPNWKQRRCTSTGEWLNKVVYTCIMQYYSEQKTNKLLIYNNLNESPGNYTK